MNLRSLLMAAIILTSVNVVVYADPAPFDLAGPSLNVTVTRGSKTLPVTEVPNLAAGDRLWIQADLPATQSAHYLLVAAFLRGSTNPPPENWFFRCEAWARKCAQEGLTVTVPADAQQLLLFLAPETGGDFKTLVNAVRGRPGAFVRTSQDLNQATLDRSRLESYLLAIRALNQTNPAKLKDAAPLLARSLAIKVDEKCLDRLPELQAPCLMQGQNSLILDDGHSTSIVEALTSGPAGDLAMEASYTPALSYGYYSPYIASVVDIARILDSFHTAQYQYIPALTAPHGDKIALTLNTPPSFHNPKSVLVVALPAIERTQLPPLHTVDPKEIFCAKKTALALPVEGAPLVFSTKYAHDMVLTLASKDGKTIELPARAEAEQGGFVVDTSALAALNLTEHIHGSLRGYWGFDKYEGPGFELTNVHGQKAQVVSNDADALIVGRDATVHLIAESASCIDTVVVRDPAGKEIRAEWKIVRPNEVELKLPLQQARPGAMTLLLSQYGVSHPSAIELHAFAEVAHLNGFAVHAGDTQGVLTGSRLDEVASVSLMGVEFVPGKMATSQGSDTLTVIARDPQAASALKQGDAGEAKVVLQDRRTINLDVAVEAARPRVKLIAKTVRPSATGNPSNIKLSNEDELPQDSKLTFSLRAQLPATFESDEKIEIATADGSFSTLLTVSNGGITLQNAKVAVATLDTAKAFGGSAFGPLQYRVLANGGSGDWQPLATLVRLPILRDLKCPSTPELACKLSGSNLYLVDSVSNDPQFGHPVQVPDGFPGIALPVPHPTDGQLYVKLRDDPSSINSASLDTQQLPSSADEAERASARQAAARLDLQPGAAYPPGDSGAIRSSPGQPTNAQGAPVPMPPQRSDASGSDAHGEAARASDAPPRPQAM